MCTANYSFNAQQLAEIAQIENALSQKYSRGKIAKKELEIAKNKEYRIKRAQWGGKYGNYYHLIAKNKKGEYVFVAGFNPEKYL